MDYNPANILDLNQSNLSDFKDCPRRFQLKSIQGKKWPAAVSYPLEGFEQSIYTGNKFHQLAHQYFLGMPVQAIKQSIQEPRLQEMFDEFETFARQFLSSNFYAEQLLQMAFGEFLLSAKYDLVLYNQDRFVIFDWKTSKNKPPLSVLAEQIQTRLYPYVLYRAGQELFPDKTITPDRIDFIYWYPLCSNHEVLVPYSSEIDSKFENELEVLAGEISDFSKDNEIFPLTRDNQLCVYCPYRTICEKGEETGLLTDLIDIDQEEGSNYYFDLGQISELEF
jgi:hypothetical protein